MPPRKNNRNKKDVSSDVQQKKRNDNDQLEKELINLFQKVQTGKISEKDGVSVLCRYYEKARGIPTSDENVEPVAASVEAFNSIMGSIVVQNYDIAEKSFPVDRSLKVFSLFCCQCLDDDLPFVEQFSWLINEFNDDQRKSYRHRTCQVILNVMSTCADNETEMSDDVWNKMRSILLVRSRDKSHDVRHLAVKALIYFQPHAEVDEDESNVGAADLSQAMKALEKDAVVQQLAFLLGVESAEIRKTILSSALVNNNTMLKCLTRHCRDVDMACRAVALRRLSQSVSINALSFQQRVDILTIAFRNSTHPAMEAAVKSLINGWLSQVGNCIADFLKVVDPICNKEICSQLVEIIFLSLPSAKEAVDCFDLLNEQKLLGDQWCTPENAFQWLELLKFLKKHNQTELLESNLPNVTEFSKFLAIHCQRIGETDIEDELINRTFVAQQFLDIVGLLDLSMDEVGRKNVVKVLECNLKNVRNNEYSRLVEQEMQLLRTLLGKQKFVHSTLEVINELRFPLGGVSSEAYDLHKSCSINQTKDQTKDTTTAVGWGAVEKSAAGGNGTTMELDAEDMETSVLREHQFQLNKLRVEIIKQRDIMDACVAERDFLKAQEEKEVLTSLEKEKDTLQESINNLKNVKSRADKANVPDTANSNEEAENKNKEDAAMLDEEMRPSQNRENAEETKDPIAIFQWLSVAHWIPQLVYFNTLPMGLLELRTTLINRLATHVDAVRRKTVQCIGVYSLFDEEYATQMLPLVVQVVLMDRKQEVQLTAFRVVFDILLRYGLSVTGEQAPLSEVEVVASQTVMDITSLNETFLNQTRIAAGSPDMNRSGYSSDSPETADSCDADEALGSETSPNSRKLLGILVKYLDNVNAEMRSVAVEGLTKLMLHDRISSCEIFCRLCILWFSPTTKQESYLRQCLGQFFPLFAIGSRGHQDCIRKSFMPVIRTIFKAPLTSPLATIDCDLMAKYLVTLMSPCNERLLLHNPEGIEIVRQAAAHQQLGRQLCDLMLSKPDESYVPLLTKALTYLDITPEATLFTQQEFFDSLVRLEQCIEGGQPKRNIARVKSRLSASLNNDSLRCSSVGTNGGEQDHNITTSTNNVADSSMLSIIRTNENTALQPVSRLPSFSAISESGESHVGEQSPAPEVNNGEKSEKRKRTARGKRTRGD